MIGRAMAAAAVAAVLMAPAAAAQVTQQDTARANAQDTTRAIMQDTTRAGMQDTTRANQGQWQQQGQQQAPAQMPRAGQAQQGRMQQGQMAMGADSMPVDTAFLAHAVSGNIKEVRLGELAQRQAENEAVKEFGQRMVTAHREAYKASRGIADTLSVGMLDSMTAEDRAVVERFSNLQGEAFDSAYMRLMVQAHAKEVAAYRNQVQFGDQAMIRRYALQVLPTLRDHFELAQQTARDIGVQVQTPLAGEMEAGPNDTTAYMTPGRDSAIAPADTSMMPRDSMMQHGDSAGHRMMQHGDSAAHRMMQHDSTTHRDTTGVPAAPGAAARDTLVRPGERGDQIPGVMGQPRDTTGVTDTTAVPAAPRDTTP